MKNAIYYITITFTFLATLHSCSEDEVEPIINPQDAIVEQYFSAGIFEERTDHKIVNFKDTLYVIAGLTSNNGQMNDNWKSDDALNWTEIASSNIFPARNGHTVEVFNNKIWTIAGFPYSNDVWSSEDGVSWFKATSNAAFSKRVNHTSLVFDNKLWVIGGSDGVDNLDNKKDVWYSEDGVNWIQATDNAAFGPRSLHTSVVFDNKMWVFGGNTGSLLTGLNDVWSSSDGINWNEVNTSSIFSKKYKHTTTVYKDHLWTIGGKNNNDIWFSSDGISWTEFTGNNSLVPMENHESFIFEDKLWVSYVDQLWSIDL